MASKIKVGKRYMLVHRHNEGADYYRSPNVSGINLAIPVTVLIEYETEVDGEKCWRIEYTTTRGAKILGWAWDRSFGDEVK